jgi:beta propeller repeat protein
MRSESPTKATFVPCVLLVLAACSAARAVTAFKVASTADDELYPSVSGNTVVWQYFNSRYGDWDIMGAQILGNSAGESFLIADFNGNDEFPVIDGSDVVWQTQYDEDSDSDVYGARVENGRTVARYAISATEDNELLPWVSDGVAVWQHGFAGAPDWDILGARLTGPDRLAPFIVSAAIDVNEMFPCISGDLVVWNEQAPDLPAPFVYGADISDPNDPRVFYTNMGMGEGEMPSLSDGRLVGRETDGVGKVMYDDLYDPFNPAGISSSGLTAYPKIHKHIVVWQDKNNGTWDIRGYNLLTGEEFAVTNQKSSNQVNPAVYVDTEARRAIVVWQDDRNGDWDIYAAVLDGPEVAFETEYTVMPEVPKEDDPEEQGGLDP